MLLLWVMVLGVCGDVVLSMEGPRGKVTREMCSKPASQVPEEHWPYCCEGYGNHCEDFAASCYLDCQPVVSSGNDVTMVEERPGFCCALYNFCCIREFARIGNQQKVEAEDQFPTFHRFHVPGKQAPKWSPAPRKNIVRQVVNNDISESPSTVNRVGRPRTPSRNNGPRERQDQTSLRSSKSLDEVNDDFSSGVSRSEQQRSRFNSQPNTVKPQRSSKPNVIKPQRNQVRFPQRPENVKTKKIKTPITSDIPTSNIGSVNANNEPSIQTDNSFGMIAPNKKTEIKSKNPEKSDANTNVRQNAQQLNREAENRKITLNRAGVNPQENLSKTNVNLKATNEENQEPKNKNQPKLVILPTTKESQAKTNPENISENKQVKEEKTQRVVTEQTSTRRQNNGRKVKMARRVLVRTAPTKINKNEQESSKSIDSEQSKTEVKSTASRRTLISNRQTAKTIRNNEKENSKSTDHVQSRQEAKPTAARRTLINNRQTSKTNRNNEKENSKSTDPVQSRQEAKPTAARRTLINNRQTPKTSRNNEQENSKSVDSVQSRQESKATVGRRTLISNRQSPRKITNNKQEITKSTDSVQSRQDLKPTASRRTILNTRQTGSRRSRPPASSTKDSTISETNQEDSNASNISGSRNKGRRIKQTVRRVIPDNTQKESVKLPTITAKEPKEVLPKQRINITNKPVTEQIASVSSNKEKNDELLKATKSDQAKGTSDVKTGPSSPDKTPSYLPTGPLNTNKTPSYLPIGTLSTDKTLGIDALKLFLDSTASQIIEDHQNNLKISEQEKEKSKDETETKSPQETVENTDVTEAHDNNQNALKIEKVNKINENRKESEASPSNTNIPKQTRTRSRTTIPIAVTNSRNKATPSTGENSAITSSRTRSRSRIRSSRTRNQDPTLEEETISTSTTNRGTSRSERIESFGRKDDSKSTVQTSPVNTENTSRRTTLRRGRQPT